MYCLSAWLLVRSDAAGDQCPLASSSQNLQPPSLVSGIYVLDGLMPVIRSVWVSSREESSEELSIADPVCVRVWGEEGGIVKSSDMEISSELPFLELREKAVINYGEECTKNAVELIQSFGLPGGLLPLQDVIEGGYVEETGFVWIIAKTKQEHHFKKAGRRCRYSETVTCFLQKNKMSNIRGVKAKDMMFWVPIAEIYIDEQTPHMVTFKSIAGFGRSLPAEHYALGA